MKLKIKLGTPRWALPLLKPSRYKGAKGGRGSGKSHFFAQRLVEHHVADPDFSSVCIREIQKSLKFSAKKLIEGKIRAMGVSHLFKITNNEISRIGGEGVMIFQGMQDHTADSIKSLEGFDLAWVEEAQSMSERSLKLLLPTIRKDNSELWFSWNPDQDTDAVDKLLLSPEIEDAIIVHVNFQQNPFCPKVLKQEAKNHLRRDPQTYDHVWLGAYNTKSDDQVLVGKCVVDEFEIGDDWAGAYMGADWGFSVDPTTVVECWVNDDILYIRNEIYSTGVEVVDMPRFFDQIPNAKTHLLRADSARPEMISHMKNHSYPYVVSAEKWKGSVEDGITQLRSFEKIVIHPSCAKTIEESRLWKYKRDRITDDVLPELIDANNHCWDAIRYAIEPITKTNQFSSQLEQAIQQNEYDE